MSEVLVINCGSSSLKYQYIDIETEQVLAKGLIAKIGETTGQREHTSNTFTLEDTEPVADHTAAIMCAINNLAHSGYDICKQPPVAVGHRVVNGGSELPPAAEINATVIQQLQAAIPLAPLHTPANIIGIEICEQLLPQVRQVAVLDTGFFHDLPLAHRTYAIPRYLTEKYHIRRFGFHGTSHEYVSHHAADLLGKPYTAVNQIVFHLGNGASVSAIKAGHPIDTSMGLTPLEGLVMGTRSGDIDPAIVAFIANNEGITASAVERILNTESGLKGLTGTNDLREVYQAQQAGNPHAQLAIDIYVHQLRKYLGAYWLELGQLDAISFTAGVGENAAWLREAVLADLTSWGITLDKELNTTPSKEPRRITTLDSTTTGFVIPTNEEIMIVRATLQTISFH